MEVGIYRDAPLDTVLLLGGLCVTSLSGDIKRKKDFEELLKEREDIWIDAGYSRLKSSVYSNRNLYLGCRFTL